MSRVHKNEVHRRVASAITSATGANDPDISILTIIHEVTEGNCGTPGRPISLGSISEAVGQLADGPHMVWSRSYFAAKTGAMASAGFPLDAGGLLPSISPDAARMGESPS